MADESLQAKVLAQGIILAALAQTHQDQPYLRKTLLEFAAMAISEMEGAGISPSLAEAVRSYCVSFSKFDPSGTRQN
jgi:hypothetical protein